MTVLKIIALLTCTGSFVSSLRRNCALSSRRRLSLEGSSFDLLMDTPVVLKGVTEIVDRYDIFLLDQFGCLHDGLAPLPGVLETLNMLKEKNKKTVILSNTSSRAKLAQSKYKRMGFVDSDITFVTSGECAWNYIDQNYRGQKCTWITWKTHGTDEFLSSLDVTTESIESADFLLFHGTQMIVDGDTTSIDLFQTGAIDESILRIFRIAIDRGIPTICANMDQTAIHNNKLAYMPGMLMDEYRRMNGTVHSFGKPLAEYFDMAIDAGKTGHHKDTVQRRILHVGDSVHHDLKGAHNANIDCLLVTDNGIHKDELRDKENDPTQAPLLMRVTDLCDRLESERPTFVIRNFEC